MNIRKNFQKGGVISDLKNLIANLVSAQPVCGKNRNEFFRKRGGGGGGGQRPFGNFPKIHPFWQRQASLSQRHIEFVWGIRTMLKTIVSSVALFSDWGAGKLNRYMWKGLAGCWTACANEECVQSIGWILIKKPNILGQRRIAKWWKTDLQQNQHMILWSADNLHGTKFPQWGIPMSLGRINSWLICFNKSY